jgi:hypothetical protein
VRRLLLDAVLHAAKHMTENRAMAERDDDKRPTAVLFIYSWDLVLALVALLGAMAAFGGRIQVGANEIDLPLPMQIFAALSAGSYCATLIMLATLLTRRQRWVWRAQIIVFALAVAIALVSLITGGVVTLHSVDAQPLLVTLFFVLLDVFAIVVLTDERIKRWYSQPGSVPRYANGAIGFWAASSAALIVFQAFR